MNLHQLDRYRQWVTSRTPDPRLIDWEDVFTFQGVGRVDQIPSQTFHRETITLPRGARVLLYGYDVERDTFVVAAEEDLIWLVSKGTAVANDIFPADQLRPNKRAYPQFTDLSFAMLMARKEADITFTTHPDAARR